MERQYDLVVVGTGVTSGVASRCREAGWTVAVVDSRPFGGTCALRGCVPKKILVSAAEAVHGARDMAGKGVPGGSLTIEEDTGRTLGAHLLGPHAEEVINLFGLAVRHGLDPARKPEKLDIAETRQRLGYEPLYSLKSLLVELDRFGEAGPPAPAF